MKKYYRNVALETGAEKLCPLNHAPFIVVVACEDTTNKVIFFFSK